MYFPRPLRTTLLVTGLTVAALLATSAWLYSPNGPVINDWKRPSAEAPPNGSKRTYSNVLVSDGLGYFSWLPTLVTDPNLCFRNFMDESSRIQPLGSIFKLSTGHGCYLPQYTAGTAILWAPLGIAAFEANRATSSNPTVNPWTNNWSGAAILVTGALVGGVLVLSMLLFLRRIVGLLASVIVVWSVALGTFAFHYATFDAEFSHIYSAALTGVLLELTRRLERRISSGQLERLVTRAAIAGSILGMIGLIRPTNLIIGLLPVMVIWPCSRRAHIRPSLALGMLTAFAITTLGTVGVQCFLWYTASGNPLPHTYVGQGFSLTMDTPATALALLTSPEMHGLLVWSPVTILCVAGLFFKTSFSRYALPALLILGMQLLIAATWSFPSAGGALGARFFVDYMPLLCIGAANFILALRPHSRDKYVLAALPATTFVSLLLMNAYWRAELSIFGITWNQYWNTLAFW